jgi:hypothetical protein
MQLALRNNEVFRRQKEITGDEQKYSYRYFNTNNSELSLIYPHPPIPLSKGTSYLLI